jgi:hypothetical protein
MVARLALFLSVLTLPFLEASSQVTTLSSDSIDAATMDELAGILSLYQYMLNTLGAPSTPVRAKETIINESYLKIFMDSAVQVEDDLITERTVVLNKSIQGYLRDVDFFFKEVRFDFSQVTYTKGVDESGDSYYEIKYVATLTLRDQADSLIVRNQDRFLEVNQDDKEGLKIVSNYTTQADPTQIAKDWWMSIDSIWQTHFMTLVDQDTVDDSTLSRLIQLDSLSLAGMQQIRDLTPLLQLRGLRYLDLGGTSILDISPIRYAANLQYLDLSRTSIDSLQVLQYLTHLKTLHLNYTHLLSGPTLSYASEVEVLSLSGAVLSSYTYLGDLDRLKELDLSGSSIVEVGDWLLRLRHLQSLNLANTQVGYINLSGELPDLHFIDLSGTSIQNLGFVKQLSMLKSLNINHTPISTLKPASGHLSLKKIFADFTNISETEVQQFMTSNQGIVVLTQTDQLLSWWNDLDSTWQRSLTELGNIRPNMLVECLIPFLQSDTLNLINHGLTDPSPLSRFSQLRFLDISGNEFEDLAFCQTLSHLSVLVANRTPLSSFKGLEYALKLEKIVANETGIQNLLALSGLPNLTYLAMDGSQVADVEWIDFLRRRPSLQAVYCTEILEKWWDNLDYTLKENLKPMLGIYRPENLHQLVRSKSLELLEPNAEMLSQLSVFQWLETLTVRRASATFIPDLSGIGNLTKLNWIEGPLNSLFSLRHLPGLTSLNISNTAVTDLQDLAIFTSLTYLDCSSTPIKSLKPIRNLAQLKTLNISNTRVWQLNWLYDIRGMESLICYNSKVSDKKIEQFVDQFPNCTITNF